MIKREKNSRNRAKLLILTIFHIFFACLVFSVAKKLFFPTAENSFYTILLFLLHQAFSLGYFYLMWNPLYANNYLHLLKTNVVKIILKNLLLTTALVLFFFFLIYLLNADTRAQHTLNQNLPIVFLQIGIQLGAFLLLHLFQLLWIYYLTCLGYLQKKVMLIGQPDKRLPVDSYFQSIIKTRLPAGTLFCKENRWYYQPPDGEAALLEDGSPEEKIFRENAGELLIFLGDGLSAEDIYRFVKFCYHNSIEYNLIPDIHKLPARDFWQDSFSYIPLLEQYHTNRDSLVYITCKRLQDMFLAFLGLIFTLPVSLVISLAIKLEDGGPILHVSKRIGRNGKKINFLKFRSMVPGAQALQGGLDQYNLRPDGPLFKMDNDPRMTRTGRIIRHCSLDEIPQLLNVLRGDISLVGPRPHLQSEVAAYGNHDNLRLECIPGMTCLPQLRDAGRIGFTEWVRLDLKYRKEWSLLLDLKIFLGSIRLVTGMVYNHIFASKNKKTAPLHTRQY